MLKLSFYNKLIVGLQSTTKVVGYFIQFFLFTSMATVSDYDISGLRQR